MDFGVLAGADRLAAIVTYALLAGSYIYGYLRPKEYAEWIVVSATSYFIFAFAAALLMMLAFAAAIEPFTIPLGLLWALLMLLLIKTRVELMSGKEWVIPLALLLLSLGQEMLAVATAPEDTAALIVLWYFMSVFVVLIGSMALGRLVDMLSPALGAAHLAEMKRAFGTDAPKKLVFRNGDVMTGDWTPGTAAMMGAIYAGWMLLRHIVLP